MSNCDKCRQLPEGIEGHDELFTYRMAGSKMQFKCRACNRLWTRSYAGEGNFTWEVASEELLAPTTPGWRPPGRGGP